MTYNIWKSQIHSSSSFRSKTTAKDCCIAKIMCMSLLANPAVESSWLATIRYHLQFCWLRCDNQIECISWLHVPLPPCTWTTKFCTCLLVKIKKIPMILKIFSFPYFHCLDTHVLAWPSYVIMYCLVVSIHPAWYTILASSCQFGNTNGPKRQPEIDESHIISPCSLIIAIPAIPFPPFLDKISMAVLPTIFSPAVHIPALLFHLLLSAMLHSQVSSLQNGRLQNNGIQILRMQKCGLRCFNNSEAEFDQLD